MRNLKIESFYSALSLIAFVSSGLFAFSILLMIFGKNETRFNELAIGENSKVIKAQFNNRPVWCRPGESSKPCYSYFQENKNRCNLVLFGFSQLFVINNYQEGEKPAPLILTKSLNEKGINIFSIAAENISPREELITLELILANTNIDGVIIPGWLQGMMMEDIRPEIKDSLSNPAVRNALILNDIGRQILSKNSEFNLNDDKSIINPNNNKKKHKTTQELVEDKLVKILEDKFTLWRLRGEAQGRITVFLKSGKAQILKLRNWILKADEKNWVNVIPPARYDINLKAKKLLLKRIKDNNLNGIVYIPPRPINDPFPFQAGVYSSFKKDIEKITINKGLSFFNLENSVKGDVWGLIKNGAGKYVIDHNHFTHSGHLQLADILEKKILSSGICKF